MQSKELGWGPRKNAAETNILEMQIEVMRASHACLAVGDERGGGRIHLCLSRCGTDGQITTNTLLDFMPSEAHKKKLTLLAFPNEMNELETPIRATTLKV